jgi:hypothetical protein
MSAVLKKSYQGWAHNPVASTAVETTSAIGLPSVEDPTKILGLFAPTSCWLFEDILTT